MKSIVFKFSFSSKTTRASAQNAFEKEYKALFSFDFLPIGASIESERNGLGFVKQFELNDRPCLLIRCRNEQQINAVMDFFYPCPIHLWCLPLPLTFYPD